MLNCLVTLVREEGLASVYQGISPALIRQAVYGTIKFGPGLLLAGKYLGQHQQSLH